MNIDHEIRAALDRIMQRVHERLAVPGKSLTHYRKSVAQRYRRKRERELRNG